MKLLKLREHRELAERAAMWFHEKWDIPAQAYRDSIQASITGPFIKDRPRRPAMFSAVEPSSRKYPPATQGFRYCRRKEGQVRIAPFFRRTWEKDAQSTPASRRP